jgi:hypothetical protein
LLLIDKQNMMYELIWTFRPFNSRHVPPSTKVPAAAGTAKEGLQYMCCIILCAWILLLCIYNSAEGISKERAERTSLVTTKNGPITTDPYTVTNKTDGSTTKDPSPKTIKNNGSTITDPSTLTPKINGSTIPDPHTLTTKNKGSNIKDPLSRSTNDSQSKRTWRSDGDSKTKYVSGHEKQLECELIGMPSMLDQVVPIENPRPSYDLRQMENLPNSIRTDITTDPYTMTNKTLDERLVPQCLQGIAHSLSTFQLEIWHCRFRRACLFTSAETLSACRILTFPLCVFKHPFHWQCIKRC